MARIFGKECHKVGFDPYNEKAYNLVLEFDDNNIVTKSTYCGEEVDLFNAIGEHINYCIKHILYWCTYKFILE